VALRCYDPIVTKPIAATWHECRACAAPLAQGAAVKPTPGRNRQYCSAACRQAALRARKVDPEGWESRQKARDRRQRNRERRAERAEGEFQEWIEGFRIGAERLAAVSEAEYEARIRALDEVVAPALDERLFDNPKVRKMLALAVASENPEEASVALDAARRAYRSVTNGS
jgi:hypothetical protein